MIAKTVALIDWNSGGHHNYHFASYSSAFVSLGCRLIKLAPDQLKCFCNVWSVAQNRRTKSVCGQISDSYHVDPPPAYRDWLPGRLRPIAQAMEHFGGIARKLRHWERVFESEIDLVFFSCVYDWEFAYFRSSQCLFPYRWAGMYNNSRPVRMPGAVIPGLNIPPCPERIFSAKRLISVTVPDEGIVVGMEQFTKGRPVVAVPEMTDSVLPSEESDDWEIAIQLLARAEHRPIIVLTGRLHPDTGIIELAEVIHRVQTDHALFFIGGNVHWPEGQQADKKRPFEILRAAQNVVLHERAIPEHALNAIFSVSDLVLAPRLEFVGSSNILTKAAAFHKPVIVCDRYSMAERTRRHGLGVVLPSVNSEELIKDLGDVLSRCQTKEDIARLAPSPDWDGYLKAHSQERLVEALGEVLSALG